MAAIEPGQYSVRDLLSKAGVVPHEAAAVDYNADGWDRRLIRVGGLRFDDLDDVVEVPEGAEKVEIEVDGEAQASLDVNGKEVPEAVENFKSVNK